MTTTKTRWPRAQALVIAEAIRVLLAPNCVRIEIAGSVRREKPDVGDIELLCIPVIIPNMGIFGDQEINLLNMNLERWLEDGTLAMRRNARGKTSYGPLNKLLLHCKSGIPIDVFSTTAEHWGMSLVVRTGPKEFNIKMMSRFRALGMRGHAYPGGDGRGVTGRDGEAIFCPTEEDVFKLLDWQYLSPADRG